MNCCQRVLGFHTGLVTICAQFCLKLARPRPDGYGISLSSTGGLDVLHECEKTLSERGMNVNGAF